MLFKQPTGAELTVNSAITAFPLARPRAITQDRQASENDTPSAKRILEEPRESQRRLHRAIAPVVLIYLAAGALWIFLSDRIVAWVGYADVTWVQTGKGWFYVLATGALLYGMIWRLLVRHARQVASEQTDRDALLERYRLLADNSTDVIWTMSLDGRFTYVSPAVVELRGYAPEEVLEQTMTDAICEESLSRVVPALAEAMERATKGEKPLTVPMEVEQPRKDGTTVWTEVTARLTTDSSGQPNGVIGVSRDVGERRRAEAALRASDERFRLSALSAGDLIYERDLLTGEAVFYSDIDARQGYAPGEYPRGLDGWLEHMHPDDTNRVIEIFGQAGREHRKYEASYRLRRKNGEYTEWIDRAIFQYDDDGNAVKIVGAAADVTDTRRAERENAALQEQLQQAMKMEAIGRLAGGVAHDFNNLLTAIMGNVELARDDVPAGGPVDECFEEIAKAARTAADLTRQLLAFSRKQVIAPRVLDLNDLIEGTRRLLVRVLGEDIQLLMRLDAQPSTIKADPGQLEQVLVNLAVNARDAMPGGGTLRLETKLGKLEERNCVVLSVIDTGVGMDESVKAHLFEPFFTTKPRGKGTGLGLATSYGAIKQIDGAIEVESAPGKGSTFRLLLPVTEEAAATLEHAQSGPPVPRGTETVLLVEDELLVRNLTKRMLDKLGYRVLQAGDGTEALAVARSHDGPIHVLLTDVVMPGMNGRELAEQLRAVRSETKVLFASGYAEDVIVHRGALDEGIDFLPKPFSIDALAKALRNALEAQA